MIVLSSVSASRDNNFNLIRFGAALGVFFSHCVPLAGFGSGGKPQLLGFICLNVFFIVSGYLVTKSYLKTGDFWRYCRARLLRIFPALCLAVIYSVFVIGLLCTTLPIEQYLTSSEVYQYVIKNTVLLISDIPKFLPGVFESSNHSKLVNAPLWSLPYEVSFYIALTLLALITAAKKNVIAFSVLVCVLLIFFYSAFVANYSTQTTRYTFIFDKETVRLASMFLFGMVFYLFRDKIKLSHIVFLGLIVLVAASAMYRPAFVAVTYASLVYAVFYFAYIPAGLLRSFNRLGDYSYGIYVFGYPTQQAIEFVWPNLPFMAYCLITLSITLILAILSWHWVERKALSYK